MKAAVFYAPGDLRIEERAMPEPLPGEVLIRVGACGVCGTDRHINHGACNATPPVVLGHEYGGIVAGLGDGIDDLALGDQIVVDPNIVCGRCPPCRKGKVQLCENLLALGVNLDGGFAEFSLASRSQCHPLPSGVSPMAGAMAEPLACCVHGIDRARIRAGDRVAVLGAGAIGLMLVQLARLNGASYVLVSDPAPARRRMALELGADEAIDPMRANPLERGGALEGGADVVIEAVGSAVTAAQAIAWAASGATVLWFGVAPPGDTVSLEPSLVFGKELTIVGARINPFTHSRALALLASGEIVVEPLITKSIGLEALPGLLADGPGDEIKVLVRP